jgi:hypothetical protein
VSSPTLISVKGTRRQIERLVDAYQASILDLEELRQRRAKLEERLAALEREAQQLAAETIRDDQLRAIAGHVEAFRARIGQRLEKATFAEKREIVELLVDRVIIDSPEVEIRYVIPLTGAAEQNRVLRSHHRELDWGRPAGETRRPPSQSTFQSACRRGFGQSRTPAGPCGEVPCRPKGWTPRVRAYYFPPRLHNKEPDGRACLAAAGGRGFDRQLVDLSRLRDGDAGLAASLPTLRAGDAAAVERLLADSPRAGGPQSGTAPLVAALAVSPSRFPQPRLLRAQRWPARIEGD